MNIKNKNISRRKFALGGASLLFSTSLMNTNTFAQNALQQKIKESVGNQVSEIVGDSRINNMPQAGINNLLTITEETSRRIEVQDSAFQEHYIASWEDEFNTETVDHCEICPVCYSVYSFVYLSILPQYQQYLIPLTNRLPRVFIVQGNRFALDDWGTVYRVNNAGQVVQALGQATITFEGGGYVAKEIIGGQIVTYTAIVAQ